MMKSKAKTIKPNNHQSYPHWCYDLIDIPDKIKSIGSDWVKIKNIWPFIVLFSMKFEYFRKFVFTNVCALSGNISYFFFYSLLKQKKSTEIILVNRRFFQYSALF